MGQRCVRGAYGIRFPTLARSSSGSKGLNLRPAAEPPPTEAIYSMSLQYRTRAHSGQCAPLRSFFTYVRSAGLPHDQRRFQGYLSRLLSSRKLFQHQLHGRLGNRLVGSCQSRQCRCHIFTYVDSAVSQNSHILAREPLLPVARDKRLSPYNRSGTQGP